ncbi:acid protease [Gonapodya prolifera JEL478]|uniref:Acid protease n=1 Tax=Gonapodya prolifera (strain JEL478) TaxID=1344416 RepID=A0A139A8J0_GONPJ|nr:acid protease [Gonapodya prolifera JEL478]|eukprot:KXS12998.1 acid protease [Gonapodya prolifera JEL478]
MINKKLITKPIISFFLSTTLSSNWSTTDSATGGKVTLGGIDEDLIDGPIAWLPNIYFDPTKLNLWNINLTSVHARAADVLALASNETLSHSAVVDTGLSFGSALRSVLDAMAKVFGATYNDSDDVYYILCDRAEGVELVFTFGAVNITIPNADRLLWPGGYPADPGDICSFAFSVKSGSNRWSLGDMFLRIHTQYSTGELKQ